MTEEDLPEGWELATLSALVSPSSEKVEPEDRPESPYLSLEHIEPHTNRIIGQGTGTDVGSTKAVFRAGDVLYGKLRPYLNKVAIPEFDGICSTDILVFCRVPHLDPKFLMRFLSRREVVEFANHNSAGVQLPRISFKELGTLEFPLPPMVEQKRIVAAVERILDKVKSARERLERLPTTLKRFRLAVLAAACSGRLTADWREKTPQSFQQIGNLEPAEASTRKAGRLWGSGEVPELTTEEIESVPRTWKWMKVGALGNGHSEAVQVGPMSMQSRDFSEKGVPVLNVGCVQWGWFDESKLDFMPAEKAGAFDRYRIATNDILFTRSGTIGRCAVATEAQNDHLMTFHLLRVRVDQKKIGSELLNFMFRGATHIRRQMEEAAIGSTRAGFNTNLLAGLDVPIPPLPEQAEIVRRVSALFALADTIEQRAKSALKRVESLTQAVLAKAFRGELVPTEAELARRENRSYEPASELLARIRSTAVAVPKAKGTRKAKSKTN
jgi:type I restriction enzyme S subunit